MTVAEGQLVSAVADRSAEITDALSRLEADALQAPSALPGWSRLVVACHLRYGADALHRMTIATLDGQPVSYYPEGREQQRPLTLRPNDSETDREVVASLRLRSRELDEVWHQLTADQWAMTAHEPDDRTDLGPLELRRLLLLRLTEVEVHGTDLALGLSDWSGPFVDAALTFRLGWLNHRRSNHRPWDPSIQGSWLLITSDGPTTLVTIHGSDVSSTPAPVDATADATIEGSSRDTLALLLGRPRQRPLRYAGDSELGHAFGRALPGP